MNIDSSTPMRLDLFRKDASTEETLMLLSAQAKQTFEDLETSFPLLKIWGSCFSGKNLPGLLLYGIGSFLLLFLTALSIGRNLFAISAKLFPVSYRHEFQIVPMHSDTILMALIRKESKRYFSSGIYVTNTIIGPVFAIVLSIALGFFDPKTLLMSAGNLPMDINATAALPFLMGLMFSIVSVSASSLSMEGKNWWILQTLPVGTKDVIQAKLLFSLIFVAPFYGVSELILLFTVPATLFERLWLLIVPAAAIIFSVTFGLFCNVKFPKFQWESEVEVVKQSAAVGLSMLGILSTLIPMLLVMMLPKQFVHVITLCAVALICALTGLLYRNLLHASL